MTRSRIASNSRARASICSGESRLRGLSISVLVGAVAVALIGFLPLSECDLDRALGGVDAGPDHLAGAAVHLAGAQVPDLAAAQLGHAGVADAHPAAEGHGHAGLLAAG